VRPSISRQLVLWLAVPLMLLALCGALVHYFNDVAPGIISSDRRLKQAATAVMAHVTIKEGRVSLDTVSASLPPLPPADEMIYAIRDPEGHFLLGDPRLPVVPVTGDSSQLLAIFHIGGKNVRTLTFRYDIAGGAALITIADVKASAEAAARYGLMSTLLWDFVQLDVTLVLIWMGIQIGLRPVKNLRDEIAARSPNDLRSIDESSVPREIAPVVVTLNRLLATVRSSVQSQQQFIANTAHQLRTPLTGLQAQLDLLIAESATLPIKGRLQTLQEGIRQLTHSANQLLSLARADPTANVYTKQQSVALDALVGEVAAKFFDRALQSNIDLGVDVQPVSMQADPALLDDLLSNLIDNALKYTPAMGRVTVSALEMNGKPFLSVEDTGPGIAEADRQRVRQRFYRLPNSPGHGSGLGLAIVEEIAKLYGGSLYIGSTAGAATGTVVQISFPVQSGVMSS
jgi:two-component system, OmpR family, sensor histidine kinase TctE